MKPNIKATVFDILYINILKRGMQYCNSNKKLLWLSIIINRDSSIPIFTQFLNQSNITEQKSKITSKSMHIRQETAKGIKLFKAVRLSFCNSNKFHQFQIKQNIITKNISLKSLITINLVIVGLGPPIKWLSSFSSSNSSGTEENSCSCSFGADINSGSWRSSILHLPAAFFTPGTSWTLRYQLDIRGKFTRFLPWFLLET